jgi:hypothetical protein
MAPIVIAKLPTASSTVREEVNSTLISISITCIDKSLQYIQRLLAISKYSHENEPGVIKYAVFIPRDEADTKTAWVIEE